MKNYRYRLFPAKSQLKLIRNQLESHRLLYNECLEYKKNVWENEERNVTCFDLIKLKVSTYKGQSNYSSLQQTVRRLDKAYTAFFKKNSKFPRFRGKGRFRTIQFARLGDGCKIHDDHIYIQGVGNIKGRFHRSTTGVPKTLSITLRGEKLFVSVFCEEKSGIRAKRDINKSIGLDLGIKSIITTSEGIKYDTPKFTKAKAKDIARLSRKKNYKALGKVYEKIANRRKDFNHKLSRKIVNEYDIICIEDLKVESIKTKIKNINSRLYDVGISQLVSFIDYKAENAGKLVIKVDPAYTTQTCSGCKDVKKKKLTERKHNCLKCGLLLDRDENAAINIMRVGLHSLTKV